MLAVYKTAKYEQIKNTEMFHIITHSTSHKDTFPTKNNYYHLKAHTLMLLSYPLSFGVRLAVSTCYVR